MSARLDHPKPLGKPLPKPLAEGLNRASVLYCTYTYNTNYTYTLNKHRHQHRSTSSAQRLKSGRDSLAARVTVTGLRPDAARLVSRSSATRRHDELVQPSERRDDDATEHATENEEKTA